MLEVELYRPVKAYLEGQGYEVKGEVGACDIMAVRAGHSPLIVELKAKFSLKLVMQGVERQKAFDHIYLAVSAPGPRGWPQRYKNIIHLCRRLGLGLLVVDGCDDARNVRAHLDPAPYSPRKNVKRRSLLLREFERRVGDPNPGGSAGVKRVTAYRQDALRCATYLRLNGPSLVREIKEATGVEKAGRLLNANHYGWFDHVSRGRYALADEGEAGLETFKSAAASLGLGPC